MSREQRNRHIAYLETEDWAFHKHRLDLARSVRDAGYRVSVVAPAGDKVAELEAEGFEFHPIRMERTGTDPLRETAAIAEIARVYRRIRPDIAHHVALKAALYGTIAARAAGVPAIVNSITGLGYTFIPGGLKRRALRAAIAGALGVALASPRVRVIFQNPDDLALFERMRIVRRSRCEIVRGSGVDTERFAPSPEPGGRPVVLLASRLLWDKGLGELVEAARSLEGRGLDFEVALAGEPDPANPASVPEETLAGWEREGLVRRLGYVEDMAAELRRAHVACLPSYREGLPLFLLEAAASARPCAATDVPGCREAVRHSESGLLVPARDSAALADALAELIGDAEERRRMGERGREIAVAEFSKERVFERIFGIYESF